MTILEEFKRNYPNAPISSDGLPGMLCPSDLGYSKPGMCKANITVTVETCEFCWNRKLEDVWEAQCEN